MISIKGRYTIPSLGYLLLIVSSLPEFLDSLSLSPNILRKECFERILRLKDRIHPKAALQWKVKVMFEHDFLKVLKQYIPRGQVLANRTSHNPDTLDLLAINLVKNETPCLEASLVTPKVLETVQDQDIIEVFI